ncbi:MAG: hypothetical protein AB8B61_01050, partial [Cyclobacteriaceae bacterium]
MAKISFFLRERQKSNDDNKLLPIHIRYRISKAKIDFDSSIGFKVPKKHWNAEKQEIRNILSILYRDEANELIHALSLHLSKFTGKNRSKGYTPSRLEIKEYYNSFFTQSEEIVEKDKIELLDFIERYVGDTHEKFT